MIPSQELHFRSFRRFRTLERCHILCKETARIPNKVSLHEHVCSGLDGGGFLRTNQPSRGEVVIAISGSGRSEDVLRAVRRAWEVGMTTIRLTGFEGGSLKDLVDIALVVDGKIMRQLEEVHRAIAQILTEAHSQSEAAT